MEVNVDILIVWAGCLGRNGVCASDMFVSDRPRVLLIFKLDLVLLRGNQCQSEKNPVHLECTRLSLSRAGGQCMQDDRL